MALSAVLRKPQQNEYLEELSGLVLPRKKNGLGYASLYCGGGGLDLGFALVGFNPLFSSDLVPAFCDTVRHNLPGHVVEPHDMNDLHGQYVLEKIRRPIDVVIGGPPCQSFSILGDRKSTRDSRGKLVYEYARFITQTKPRAFLFENVPGILTVNKGRDWHDLLTYFSEETGYHVIWTRLNAVMFGVPQFRQRVVAIGFRTKTTFAWPEPKYSDSLEQPKLGLRPPRQAWMALEDVDGLPNQILRVHCERVESRYSKIPPGGRDRKDHTDRVHPERPSGTVLVGSGAGGGVRSSIRLRIDTSRCAKLLGCKLFPIGGNFKAGQLLPIDKWGMQFHQCWRRLLVGRSQKHSTDKDGTTVPCLFVVFYAACRSS